MKVRDKQNDEIAQIKLHILSYSKLKCIFINLWTCQLSLTLIWLEFFSLKAHYIYIESFSSQGIDVSKIHTYIHIYILKKTIKPCDLIV